MKFRNVLAMILMIGCLAIEAAHPQNPTKEQNSTGLITTSGTSVTLDNKLGTVSTSFEVVIAGTPDTVSVVIKGCMRGDPTCADGDTLDTYTTVANSIRKPTVTVGYDFYKVTASWTGGTSPSVNVFRLGTMARNGGGGGSATSPLTTKGDVWGFSSVDARVPIGTNNQVLTADSTQALGLKWATPSGAVSSVFTRTGAVVAATNDYNFNQLAGSVAAGQMPALTGDCTTSAGAVAVNCGSAIARTGTDINTSNQVTVTHLASALPVAQGGTGLTSGTSGGIPAYTAAGTIASSAALAAGQFVLGGGAGVAPSTSFSIAPVANGGTGIASGTSGGVPYYSGSTTIASSGALTNNAAMFGGGAGAAPKVDTLITTDGSGKISAAQAVFSGSTVITPASAASGDIGSQPLPFKYGWIAGDSTSPATNNFKLTGVCGQGTCSIVMPNIASVNLPLECSNTSANTAITNTTTETYFSTNCKVPANYLTAGMTIQVGYRGIFSALVTDTITLKIKACQVSGCASGTVVQLGTNTALAPGALSNQGWLMDSTTVIYTIGSSGTMDTQGYTAFQTAATAITFDPMVNTATATVNTTVDEYISVSGTWSAASASDTISARNIRIIIQ